MWPACCIHDIHGQGSGSRWWWCWERLEVKTKLKTIWIGQNIYLYNSYLSTVYIQILSNVPEYLSTRISIVDVLEMPYDLYIRLHRHLSTPRFAQFAPTDLRKRDHDGSCRDWCAESFSTSWSGDVWVWLRSCLPSRLKRSPSKKAPMIEASRAVSMWKSSWGDVQHPTPNPLVFSVFGSPNISQKLAIPLILQTGGFKSSIVITSCGCLSNSPIFIISNHNQP